MGNNNNINPFKTGDKVVCIDDNNTMELEIGRTYIVESISDLSVYLKNLVNCFYAARFKLAEATKRKFKVGDKVVFTWAPSSVGFKTGCEYVVEHIGTTWNSDNPVIHVRNSKGLWVMSESSFKHASEPKAVEFKRGDKVVCVNAYNSFYLKYGKEYTVDCCLEGCVLLKELLSVRGGFEIDRFKLVPQEPSFKAFLSPMCRVQLRNGFRLIFDEDVVAVKNSTSHILLNQYADDGHVTEAYKNMFDNHLQIVKVFAKPASTDDLFDPSKVGKLLWESPELIAEKAKKEEKIKAIQQEIRATSKVMEDLVKQLKELE